MKRALLGLLFLTQIASAQNPAQRVADDALVFDRVGQASKRDLPVDLLKRIIEEDIDLLRGKRDDGSYQYATFERFDSGRFTQAFSIQPRGADKMEQVEVKGEYVYRVLLEVPSRKLLVRRNSPVWVERVDLEYLPERGTQIQRESIEIKQWLQAGEFRPVDLPAIARQATVKVVAAAEEKRGYGNLVVALLKARIVDNADSPYADAVASAKAIQRAVENKDVPSMRAMAQRMRNSLTTSGATIDVVERRLPPPVETARSTSETNQELRIELQDIEDLLTGSEQERRQGMDRLHQLIRRLRQ
jgi:hypothetical protein